MHTIVKPSRRPISGSNYEDVLLAAHAIHLSQQLVDDSICCTAPVTHTAST